MYGHYLAAPRRFRLAVIATVAMFTIMGLAEPIYSNLSLQFSAFFGLDSTRTVLTLALVSATYFLFAIPSAVILRKVGYKLAVLLGLGGFAGGVLLIYPAITQHAYGFFVVAAVTTGAGYSLLETSVNPLIVQMGHPRTAVFRLNFAQAFYPVGLLAGVYATRVLMASNHKLSLPQMEEEASRPYLLIGLALVLLAFLIENLEFPKAAVEPGRVTASLGREFASLLKRPLFRFGMAAQAANIAAQTCAWAIIPLYLHGALPTARIAPADVLLWSWIAYAAGRFAGTYLMVRIRPCCMLAGAAAGALILFALAGGAGGWLGLACLVGANFFLSIMFPTIFANAVRDLGPLTKSGSGLIVASSGLGVTLAMAAMDVFPGASSQFWLAAIACCFAAVFAFGVADYSAQRAIGPCNDDEILQTGAK